MTSDLDALLAEADAVVAAMSAPLSPFIPVQLTAKQQAFYDSDADEVLYGGAAGGGKTVALLATAAKHVETPGYSAVIFRRTFPQLSQPHGIMDLANEWWANAPGVSWSAEKHTYTFPSGATLKFSHLANERDKYSHQGSEYHFIGWDELTQFTETQFSYLKTRRRKTHGDPIPLSTRATTNPGGEGHYWVKKRYITDATDGHVFMPATMEDNPHLDRESYEESFEGLDSTTREQLKEGRWIDNAGGLVYPIPATSLVQHFAQTPTTHYLISCDLGTSEKYPSTAILVGAWDTSIPHLVWVLRAQKIAGLTTTTTAEHIRALMREYPASRVIVDAGALGGGYVKEFRQRHQLPAFAAEKRDKLGNRRLLRGSLEDGYMRFLEPMCGDLLEECGALQWNDTGTDVAQGSVDHAADAMLYLYRDAQAWMSRTPETPPAQGTPEWYARAEQDMIDAEVEQCRREHSEDASYGY